MQRSTSGCELVAEVARRFGVVCFKATGVSMMPAVWPNDVLTVRSCGITDLQPGFIVLYQREEKLVAHRITRIQGNVLITRGDSVQHDDSPVHESEIVGQVVSVIRRGRRRLPDLSVWSRAGSYILRRSNFCLRAALRLTRWLRRSDNEEISWA